MIDFFSSSSICFKPRSRWLLISKMNEVSNRKWKWEIAFHFPTCSFEIKFGQFEKKKKTWSKRRKRGRSSSGGWRESEEIKNKKIKKKKAQDMVHRVDSIRGCRLVCSDKPSEGNKLHFESHSGMERGAKVGKRKLGPPPQSPPNPNATPCWLEAPLGDEDFKNSVWY